MGEPIRPQDIGERVFIDMPNPTKEDLADPVFEAIWQETKFWDVPERIQLKRSKGWRMPANTVKVDRTTPWGNPFVVGKPGGAYTAKVVDRRHAYLLYKSIAADNANLVAAARSELRGKNLACWCPKDDPYEDACHAAVLLEIANS